MPIMKAVIDLDAALEHEGFGALAQCVDPGRANEHAFEFGLVLESGNRYRVHE